MEVMEDFGTRFTLGGQESAQAIYNESLYS
jgi:hypothetical protein